MYTFHSLSALFAPEGPNGTPEQNEQPTQNQDFDFVQAPIFKKGYGNRMSQTILPKHTPSETTQTLDKIQALEQQNKITPQDAATLKTNIHDAWINTLKNQRGTMILGSEEQLRAIANVLGTDQTKIESLATAFRENDKIDKKSHITLDASGNLEIKPAGFWSVSTKPIANITYTLTPEQIQTNATAANIAASGPEGAEAVAKAEGAHQEARETVQEDTRERIEAEKRPSQELFRKEQQDIPLAQGQYLTKPLYENREEVQGLLAQLPEETQKQIMPGGRLDVMALQKILEGTQVAKNYEPYYKAQNRNNVVWADGKFGMQTLAALKELAPLLAAQAPTTPTVAESSTADASASENAGDSESVEV